tara:strand:+ start:2270 stop:2644 length:375 start_codon:yes stop_codon:yes gene_type:complete
MLGIQAMFAIGNAMAGGRKGGSSQREMALASAQRLEGAKNRALERGKPILQQSQTRAKPRNTANMEDYLGLYRRSMQFANNLTDVTRKQMVVENKSDAQIKQMERYFQALSDADVKTQGPKTKI